MVLVEEMEGNKTYSLWGVLCVLERRPSSEDEIAMLRRGVIVEVNGKHKAGTQGNCCHQRKSQGRSTSRERHKKKDGRTTGGGSLGSGGGIQGNSVPGNEDWGGIQRAGGLWRQAPAVCRHPVDQIEGLRSVVASQGSSTRATCGGGGATTGAHECARGTRMTRRNAPHCEGRDNTRTWQVPLLGAECDGRAQWEGGGGRCVQGETKEGNMA